MGHTFSNLLVHVIFATKDRLPLIDDAVRPHLHKYMAGIARKEFIVAPRVGGTENHIHGLLVLPCDVSVSAAMAKWKSLSSGWMNRLPERQGKPRFAWQTGYGAFTVSESNRARVVRYIDGQVEHHRQRTFEEEFIQFLRRHRIKYDPRTVWE